MRTNSLLTLTCGREWTLLMGGINPRTEKRQAGESIAIQRMGGEGKAAWVTLCYKLSLIWSGMW